MWTKTPTRTLSEETELSCLRVFALTVMADVARLKLQSAEEAKTDILGSISHELRSPLHGLVGAVELLKDTSLDTVQDGILSAIESSGRTLLDTIEHVSILHCICNEGEVAGINMKSYSCSIMSRPTRKSLRKFEDGDLSTQDKGYLRRQHHLFS